MGKSLRSSRDEHWVTIEITCPFERSDDQRATAVGSDTTVEPMQGLSDEW